MFGWFPGFRFSGSFVTGPPDQIMCSSTDFPGVQNHNDFIFVVAFDFNGWWRSLKPVRDSVGPMQGQERDVKDQMQESHQLAVRVMRRPGHTTKTQLLRASQLGVI
jgi:hypothetical protein